MNNLLIVVDMVNGFVKGGALADKGIERIIPHIIKKIKDAIADGDTVVAFRDAHGEDDEEFKTYPPHCLKGTWESELIEELKPYEKYMIDIEKNTTNGFYTDKMQQILANNNFGQIFVTGCCSDICVTDVTKSLLKYFKENNITTRIVVNKNCIDTFNGPNHNADEINNIVINNLKSYGIMTKKTENKITQDKSLKQDIPTEKE